MAFYWSRCCVLAAHSEVPEPPFPGWDLTSHDWAISKLSPPPPHPIPANTLPKSCPTSVPFLKFAWPDHSRVGGGKLNCRDCLVLQGPLARGQESRYNYPDMEGARLLGDILGLLDYS